ncbi:MAG: fumarylacetoacetate hydrolase family protein, partial [Rhodospirillaceae bacterium]
IGRSGKNIKAENIADHVWGVTLLGDWSIRMSPEGGPLKFALQKNFDGCCSVGPCILVGDIDFMKIDVETSVNGEGRQKFVSGDMAFSYA